MRSTTCRVRTCDSPALFRNYLLQRSSPFPLLLRRRKPFCFFSHCGCTYAEADLRRVNPTEFTHNFLKGANKVPPRLLEVGAFVFILFRLSPASHVSCVALGTRSVVAPLATVSPRPAAVAPLTVRRTANAAVTSPPPPPPPLPRPQVKSSLGSGMWRSGGSASK